MNVTIVGSGNMGSAFVKCAKAAGHAVVVTGRNADKARELASANGAAYKAPAEAARGADVIVIATGYADAASALKALGDVAGKTVVDITNPLTADYMGLAIGHSTSAAEEIQKAVPAARVVKAFNTVFAPVLAAGEKLGGATVQVFYAGDQDEAKATVRTLIDSLGFKAVDAGGLKNARYLEPVAGFNIYLGYGAGKGTSIAPAWVGLG